MIDTPRDLSMRIVSNSVLISRLVSGAVGSSMMSTLELMERDLATSTICLCATPRSRTSVCASMSTPRSSSSFCASANMRPQSTMKRFFMIWRPMKMFSATVSCSVRFSS